MSLRSLVRPRRRTVFPFCAALYPLLWFINRDASIIASRRPAADVLPRATAFAVGAVISSYVVAVVAAAMVDSTETPTATWKRWLFAPSNGALGLFTVVSLALGVQLLDWASVPGWLSGVERLLGGVVGWPLIVTYLVAAFGLSPLIGGRILEFVGVAVGVALSVAWLFVLSGRIADAARRFVGTAVRSRE